MNRLFEINTKKFIGAMVLSTMGISMSAHAFSPLSTDDSGTMGRANAGFEIGYNFERNTNLDTELDNRIDVREFASSLPMTFSYGVTNNIDLSLGVSRQLFQPSGWQNPELGLKWHFYGDPSQGWSAAVKPTVILPVSKRMQDKGLGNAKANVGMTLIGSYVTPDYELHANLNYTSNYQADTPDWEYERNHLWSASIAPVWVINDQWKMGLDLGLRTNPGFSSATEAFTQLGVSYAPVENLQIGLGVGTAHAIGAESRDRGLSVATTVAYQF